MAWWQAPGDSGAPQKKAGEHQPCCSSLTAGRCSRSAEQKAIAVFFQCFESTVALPGEGDGKRSQVSSRELGGLRGLQLGTQQLLCYLPQRKKLAVLYKCVRRYLGSEQEETVPWA